MPLYKVTTFAKLYGTTSRWGGEHDPIRFISVGNWFDIVWNGKPGDTKGATVRSDEIFEKIALDDEDWVPIGHQFTVPREPPCPTPEEKLTEYNKLVGDWPESEGSK